MNSPSKDDLAAILYQALGEPIGLLLSTSDSNRARQKLYQARAAAADPALDVIQIRISPFPEGDLVLVKSTVQVPVSSSRPNQIEDF